MSYVSIAELTHHGILGMKWGIRRYQNPDGSLTNVGKKRYISDRTQGIKKDISSYKNIKGGVKDKSGRVILTPEDVDKQVSSLKSLLAKREEHFSQKWDVEVTRRKIESAASVADRFIYSPGVARTAAKYVVKNNMSISDALKKTKKEAWINSAIYVAAMSGIIIAETAIANR